MGRRESMSRAVVAALWCSVGAMMGIAAFAQSTEPIVEVTAQVQPLMLPETNEVSMGWSVLFRGVNYTQQLDDAVTACYDSAFAEVRGTDDTNLESFTPVAFYNYTIPMSDGIMVLYFTNVNHRAEDDIGSLIVRYTEDGLGGCINDDSFVLTQNPALLADGGQGLFASAAEWIIGIVAGCLILALVLGALWFMLRGRKRTYDLSEYADEKEYDSD